jgi:hypothetical protein
MLVDTDVLIWLLRSNAKAAQAIDRMSERAVSVIAYSRAGKYSSPA